MLVTYYEGYRKLGKSHCAGPFQCDRDDFYTYWQYRPDNVYFLNVYLQNGEHWTWTREKKWQHISRSNS